MQALLSLEYCLFEAVLICEDSTIGTTLKCARKCEAWGEVKVDNRYNVYLLD